MTFSLTHGSLLGLRTYAAISGAMVILAGIVACETAGSRRTHVKAIENEPCLPTPVRVSPPATGTYDQQVLSLAPSLYLTFGSSSSEKESDLSGNGHMATYLPVDDPTARTTLPNGDAAAEFNGHGQYAEVPSSSALSVTHTGCLTVEAWIRPATLQFPKEEGMGYVYILGKGTTGSQEYALRMYSASNSEKPERPNRISGYVFNPAGGLGSGAYFQDKIEVGVWIMITLVVDDRTSSRWPHGYVAMYKDGHLRGQVSLSQYHVIPRAGNAPLCIGTRNFDSYFEGAIGKVAVYDSVLSSSQIAATYNSMYARAS